jgi:hypothetical protein
MHVKMEEGKRGREEKGKYEEHVMSPLCLDFKLLQPNNTCTNCAGVPHFADIPISTMNDLLLSQEPGQ